MLRKQDSSEILKRVKVILFATSLSLLYPMNMEIKVQAEPIKEEQNIQENDFYSTKAKKMIATIGITVFIGEQAYMWFKYNELNKKVDNLTKIENEEYHQEDKNKSYR